jgi:hypothetical protein
MVPNHSLGTFMEVLSDLLPSGHVLALHPNELGCERSLLTRIFHRTRKPIRRCQGMSKDSAIIAHQRIVSRIGGLATYSLLLREGGLPFVRDTQRFLT